MLNSISSLATRAGQRILGNPNEDDQQLSPVTASSSGSTVHSDDSIERISESQPATEDLPSSEESQSHDPDQQAGEVAQQPNEVDQQPVELEQHHEEKQHPVTGGSPRGDDRGLEDDEDSGSETRAQASAFNRLFDGAQPAEHSVRETPPSIEGYKYRDQLPAYSSQPPSGAIVIPNVEDGAWVSGGGIGDMSPDAGLLNQQTHERQDGPTSPPFYLSSTLDQELQGLDDFDSDDLSNNPASTISGTETDNVRGISANQQVPGERQADAAQAPFKTTPDKLVGEQELLVIDNEGPDPPSPPSEPAQDLHSAPQPIFVTRREAGDNSLAPFFKGETQRPGETMADVITRDQIRRAEAIRERFLTDGEKEVIRSFYRDMDRPRAPDEVSEPTSIHSAGALAEVNRKMATGFFSNASDISRGFESGRSPTDYEAEIEDLKYEAGRMNDLIDALTNRLQEVEGRVDADRQQLLTAMDKRTGNLFRKFSELQACQDEAGKQLMYSYEQLHAASADIAKFQAEKKATQERVETLERELQAVKMELHTKSRAAVSRSTNELRNTNRVELDGRSTAGLDNNKSNELDNESKVHTTTTSSRSYGPDPHSAETTQPPSSGRWFQVSIGFNVSYVVSAITVLVWLVTEGMLHSKRLSEGYGPFINGGYNGLGSVVIFGTWPKFFLFYAMAVYLGVVSIRAAMAQ